jgi:alcohol dehydrogenase class IV
MLELGFVEQVQDRLWAAHIECKTFSDVEHEPTLDIVQRGAAAMSAYQPDWVVGLGGGTPMDAAKAMWILYENPQVDLLTINPIEPLKLRQKAKMIAISATSGTGAEVSWGIVLTDPSVRQKLAVGSPENLPDIAIVDPALAVTMSPQLTADTGMDALTHAIEGYTSTWNNDFSDGLCLKAIQLIFRYLPLAVSTGADWDAREKMHNAAAIAGLGFINSMCSLAHALGHSLGAQYQLPHGRAVGLFLPYTIQFNASDHDSRTRYGDIAVALGLPGATPQQGAESLVRGIHQLAEQIGQPGSIGQALDVSLVRLENDLEILTEHAASDTQIITAVRSPTTEDIEKLFLYAYDGRTIDW